MCLLADFHNYKSPHILLQCAKTCYMFLFQSYINDSNRMTFSSVAICVVSFNGTTDRKEETTCNTTSEKIGGRILKLLRLLISHQTMCKLQENETTGNNNTQ